MKTVISYQSYLVILYPNLFIPWSFHTMFGYNNGPVGFYVCVKNAFTCSIVQYNRHVIYSVLGSEM